MARKVLVFTLSFILIGSAFGGDQQPLSGEIKKQLSTKYPNHKVVNWCTGKFVGKEADAVAVLRDESKKQFLVLWVMSQGGIQELDSVAQTDSPTEFELQCMDAKEAKETQDTLQHSEGISSSLKVLKGLGAVCYFIDQNVANCWSLDRPSGHLVRIGAWET